MLGVLELWRRAEASASPTEEPEDVGGLLLRDPDALLLAETADGEIVGTLIAAGTAGAERSTASRSTRPAAARASPPPSSTPARSASAPSARAG